MPVQVKIVNPTLLECEAPYKVVLDRDTGSVDPGSRPNFGSVSESENHFSWFLVSICISATSTTETNQYTWPQLFKPSKRRKRGEAGAAAGKIKSTELSYDSDSLDVDVLSSLASKSMTGTAKCQDRFGR